MAIVRGNVQCSSLEVREAAAASPSALGPEPHRLSAPDAPALRCSPAQGFEELPAAVSVGTAVS